MSALALFLVSSWKGPFLQFTKCGGFPSISHPALLPLEGLRLVHVLMAGPLVQLSSKALQISRAGAGVEQGGAERQDHLRPAAAASPAATAGHSRNTSREKGSRVSLALELRLPPG